MGCTATVEFFGPDQNAVTVGYQIQGGAVSGLSISAIDERPWAVARTISTTGEQKKIFKINIPCAAALGLTKAQYKNDTDNYGAASGASPVVGVYLRLFAVSAPAGTATNLRFRVSLSQNTVWWTRSSLPQS